MQNLSLSPGGAGPPQDRALTTFALVGRRGPLGSYPMGASGSGHMKERERNYSNELDPIELLRSDRKGKLISCPSLMPYDILELFEL